MSARKILKVVGLWFLIAVLAVANGFLRDVVIAPVFGMEYALPLSGVTLSLIIMLVSFYAVSWLGPGSDLYYLGIGTIWVMMTLGFEYGTGYFLLGLSFQEISQVFDLAGGNLFAIVLLVTLLAPMFLARIRRTD